MTDTLFISLSAKCFACETFALPYPAYRKVTHGQT